MYCAETEANSGTYIAMAFSPPLKRLKARSVSSFSRCLPDKKRVELVPVPVVQHRTDQIRIIDRQPLKTCLFPGAFDFAAKMTGDLWLSSGVSSARSLFRA